MSEQNGGNRKDRPAQFRLASEVTKLVHGEAAANSAKKVTEFLAGKAQVSDANEEELSILRREIPNVKTNSSGSIIDALVKSDLANSNTAARQLIGSGSIYVNNERIERDNFQSEDFNNNRLLIRRGKAYRDSALVELDG